MRILCALFVAALPVLAGQWEVTTVDSLGTGKFSSLRVDEKGNVHVAYTTDDDKKSLRYSFRDHGNGKWFTMTVAQHASFCALALDSKSHPHISYVDAGTVIGAKLRYAHWDGTAWKTEALPLNADIITYFTSIALDSKDRPNISYYEYEGAEGIGFVLRLRVVTWNGQFWEARTADQQPGSGKFNSIAIDSAGHIDVAYANVKAEHAGLRFAQWDGKNWDHNLLEGGDSSPTPMYSVRLALDRQDNPHIAYSDTTNHLIKFGSRVNGKWSLETVDAVGAVGYPDRNGLSLDDDGNPYLSYYDEGRGCLKIAYKRDGKWVAETVDRNYSGYTSSIQVRDGVIWVSYADSAHRCLKVARCAVSTLAAPMTAEIKK